MRTKKLTIKASEHELPAILHSPKGSSSSRTTVAVLAPGSGYTMDMPLMKNTAEALAKAGNWVLRFDWGFRAEKNGQPSELLDRELVDLMAAVEHARSLPDIRHILLVGKSIGARIVAEAIARGWVDAAGVVLLAWPLHAANNPGRPWGAKGTVDPLGSINCPCAVVVGDADAICQLDALQKTLADKLPAARLVVVPGDHSLKSTNAEDTDANVKLATHAIVRWCTRFVQIASARRTR